MGHTLWNFIHGFYSLMVFVCFDFDFPYYVAALNLNKEVVRRFVCSARVCDIYFWFTHFVSFNEKISVPTEL